MATDGLKDAHFERKVSRIPTLFYETRCRNFNYDGLDGDPCSVELCDTVSNKCVSALLSDK